MWKSAPLRSVFFRAWSFSEFLKKEGGSADVGTMMIPSAMETSRDRETPLVDVLFENTEGRRLDSWIRRFGRELQDPISVGDGDHISDLKQLLETVLINMCTSDWEMKNLEVLLRNDGTVQSMNNIINQLKQRKQRKEEKKRGGSRYGPLAVQLSEQAAVKHKKCSEPDYLFRASTSQLQPLWPFLKPSPRGKNCRPNSVWELRLTFKPWTKWDDDRATFVVIRSRETYDGHKPQRSHAEETTGLYEWQSTLHNGEVISESELILTMEEFGNTDKSTGESTYLRVTYQRNYDNPREINYVNHEWGRTTCSEMINIEERFPPRLFESDVEELNDEEVGNLIKKSFARLARANAGVEDVHKAHLPPPRKTK